MNYGARTRAEDDEGAGIGPARGVEALDRSERPMGPNRYSEIAKFAKRLSSDRKLWR
jgi:hypothetical protein